MLNNFWGALILASQSGRKQAIAWLHQQPNTYNPQDVENLLNQLEQNSERAAAGKS